MADDKFLRVELVPEKKLLGKKLLMSFAENRTVDLWKSFMPEKKSIPNIVNTDLYSLEVYPGIDFFNPFNPSNQFEKWAAVEVRTYATIPPSMEKLIIPKSLYAVFIHRGLQSEAVNTYNYIFREWLPASDFQLDHRPHFAVMGSKYQKDSANSEEEIYIPVKEKS